MSDPLILILAWAGGLGLGVFFYGGLWWTIRKGVCSPRPALWFFVSLMLRMSIILAGFYFVSGGRGDRLVACLVGFVIARLIVVKVTRPASESSAITTKETGHAA